jgi:hypothetical protein
MKTIFTVIPYFSNGIEIFVNEVKSFSTYDDAVFYATDYCSGKTYDIIENELN